MFIGFIKVVIRTDFIRIKGLKSLFDKEIIEINRYMATKNKE